MNNIYNYSKSNILIFLKKKINNKNCIILDQINFTKSEYLENKNKIISKIINNFVGKNIIIRSSSADEDKLLSNAGKYKSFLNIKTEKSIIKNKIDQVINLFSNSDDVVFIQEYISKISISGVIFTASFVNSSPYYILNYDYSKKTNLITSGSNNPTMQLMNIYKFKNNIEDKFKNLINIIKKIELIFPNNLLDIEFAIEKKKVYIFQCRSLKPITKNNKILNINKQLSAIKKKIKKLFLPNPSLYGSSSLLSNMADWNPAEMIGAKSTKFTSSLYKTLITNQIWAEQRVKYGYRDVRPNPLMINIGSYNYIDIRTDLNSFLPNDLKKNISNKLINFYLKKLKLNNFLHDKIEFSLIPTCYQSNLKKYLDQILNKEELIFYIKSLRKLTSSIINPKNNIIKNEENLINQLEIKTNEVIDSKLSEIQKIFLIITICKKYGTLPFAGLARCSFIAKKIFDNISDDKYLTKSRLERFYSSVPTIINELNLDLIKLKNNKLTKNKFLKIYGHLRPSTYSISSLSYRENFNYYFNLNKINKNTFQINKFYFSKNEKNLISKWIKKEKLNFRTEDLITFTKKSIYLREKSKFFFSNTIDKLFTLIIKFLKKHKINRSDIEFLDLEVLLQATTQLNLKQFRKIIIDNISVNKDEYFLSNKVILPDLILNSNDCYYSTIKSMRGNYIGSLKCIGQITTINNKSKKLKIDNKIVLIENADPGYDFIFNYNIKGLITMYGGPNSHMAIRCNELNLPAVIGIGQKEYNNLKKYNNIEIDCNNKITKLIN